MKKIAMFMSALALAFTFASCEKGDKDSVDLDNVTEDGFYVSGPATGAEALSTDYMMAAGLNEAADLENGENPNRSGMFEKYVALEAGKEFYLVLYTNGVETKYGANLETFDVAEKQDNPRDVEVKRGLLVEGADAPSMTVAENGLYHIILDLNEGGDLAFGKQIVVAPVNWGERGITDSANWSWNAMTPGAFNQKTMTWTATNLMMKADGYFKFAYSGAWKLDLDDAGKVKANTNLGIEAADKGELGDNALVPNGKDIKLSRGYYTVTLTWTLKGGAIKNGYSATIVKTGEVAAPDYSNCQVELVGDGVVAQDGAVDDESGWNWGNVYRAANDGKPVKNGDVYTWTWSNVQLSDAGWKVRSLNGSESGGQNLNLGAEVIDFENSAEVAGTTGDIKLKAAGTYNVTLVVDANANTTKLTIVSAN